MISTICILHTITWIASSTICVGFLYSRKYNVSEHGAMRNNKKMEQTLLSSFFPLISRSGERSQRCVTEQRIGVTKEDAGERESWRQMIHCGDP